VVPRPLTTRAMLTLFSGK